MKKLKQFQKFDYNAFLKDKTFIYNSGKVIDNDNFTGVKVELMVLDDNTDYGDGETGINELENLTVKIPNVGSDFLKGFTRKNLVKIVNVEKASVWGEYNDKLSLIAKVVLDNGSNK